MFHIDPPIRSVAILGGGMAGTLAAIQLLRQATTALLIRIIDPQPELGRGLAYGTADFGHRLNGPAKAFSLRPEDSDHFANWLQAGADQGGWHQFDDCRLAFAPRWLFGDYIRDELRQAIAAAVPGVVLEHVQARVIDIELVRTASREQVRIGVDAGGRPVASEFVADHLLLAPGVFKAQPTLSMAVAPGQADCYLADPWNPVALDKLATASDVVLIGSSLTMIDAVVALEARGFRGNYQVVSRRGLLPHMRREVATWPEFLRNDQADGAAGVSVSALGMLRTVRHEIDAAVAAGEDWQRVVMAVRPHLPWLWAAASLPQQQRFLRHARAHWDIFLHRAPPSSAEVFETVRAAGRLQVHAGTPVQLSAPAGGRASLAVRLRGQLQPGLHLAADAVINCSGFEYVWQRVKDQPVLARLLEKSYVRPSALGLGIDADPRTLAVIGGDGQPSSVLSVSGLPLHGVLFEAGTIGELLRQSLLLAPRLDAVGQAAEIRRLP